jgi:hypothetical protein
VVDAVGETVLADVLPLSMPERFGSVVAVGDAVAAGVVGVSLACLAVSVQWVVPLS